MPETLDLAELSRLEAQTLPPGECALFVWTGDAERKFILYSRQDEGGGVWGYGGTDTLAILGTSGTPENGQYPNAKYESQRAGILTLSLKQAETQGDAVRYAAGTLSYKDAGDWTRVIPVIGLSTCQPETASP